MGSTTDNRGTCWSVTINNPTEDDVVQIREAEAKGWRVEGQKEVGEGGTPHLQLLVRTPQVRFAHVKKQFPRAHIELARSSAALRRYVHKADTRVGELPPSSDRYPSQTRFWLLVNEHWNESDYREYRDDLWRAQLRAEGPHIDNCEIRLRYFDVIVERLIRMGYHVEHHGINPQVRGVWQRWSSAILHRSQMLAEEIVEVVDIPTTSDVPPPSDETSPHEAQAGTPPPGGS